MKTIKGIKEELKLLNGILKKIQNGENINVHVIERCLNIIQEPIENTVIRGLPETKIPQNLLDEREKKIGEVYIKLAEIDCEEVKAKPQYSQELLDLFNGHKELINKLIGKSDDEKAQLIREWNKGKDGKPLIKNFKDRLRKEFATQLKKAGLISESIENFRKKLS